MVMIFIYESTYVQLLGMEYYLVAPGNFHAFSA